MQGYPETPRSVLQSTGMMYGYGGNMPVAEQGDRGTHTEGSRY